MQTEQIEVRSKGDVVGTADYNIYVSTEEALRDIGEEKLLELVNSQVKTNAMNTVRGEKTGSPSQKYLRSQAVARLTMEEFTSAAGDAAALDLIIERHMAEIKASHESVEATA